MIKKQDDDDNNIIDKIYSYVKYPHEAKRLLKNMFIYQRALRTYVLTFQRVLSAHVAMDLSCLCFHMWM